MRFMPEVVHIWCSPSSKVQADVRSLSSIEFTTQCSEESCLVQAITDNKNGEI